MSPAFTTVPSGTSDEILRLKTCAVIAFGGSVICTNFGARSSPDVVA
jgi:hypothetical protein